MAAHSSILAGEIPWTEEPDGLQSMGLQKSWIVHPKGDQSWVFIERTDVEAETPILWPPDAES